MRRFLALFVAAALLVSVGLTISSTDPASASEDLKPVADCIRKNGRLAALFMVDESGSLRQTDPNADRVAGLQAALAGLTELTQGESSIEVQVALWGFAASAAARNGWTVLNSSSAGSFQSAAEEFRQRDNGFDTDYVAALTSGREELARRVVAMDADGSKPVCKLLLWFTDGKLDIEDRLTPAARRAHGTSKPWAPEINLGETGGGDRAITKGRELICSRDGLAQRLRDDGVFTAAVALETAIAQPDRNFLSAIATGSGEATTCGTPGPAAEQAGAYLGASNVDELILSLFEATGAAPISPGVSAAVCPTSTPCPEGTEEFTLDATLSRFNVLAVSRDPEVAIVLRSPGGQEITLTRGQVGTGTAGSAEISWRWFSSSAVLISGALPDTTSDWVGTWRVTFVDTTGTNANVQNRVAIYVFGNLEARVAPNSRLRKGEPGTIRIQVVNPKGEPKTSPDFLESVDVRATTAIPGEAPKELRLSLQANGEFVGKYTPAAALTAVALKIHTDLTIKTSVGIELPTVGIEDSIPLDPPIGFPSIDLPKSGRGTLILSPVTEPNGSAEAELRFHRLEAGTACVWLSRFTTSSHPKDTKSVAFSMTPGASSSECLEVKADGEMTAQLTAQVVGFGRGRVTGEVVIGMRSNETGKSREEAIPVRFEMDVPPVVNRSRALLLMVIGALAPLALLYLLNWITARFGRFDAVRYLATTCLVGPGNQVNPAPGRAVLLEGAEAKMHPSPESLRRFEIGPFVLSGKVAKSPFGAPYGLVTRPDGVVMASDLGVTEDAKSAKVSLGLGRSWIIGIPDGDLHVAVDSDDQLRQPVKVQVLALFSDDEAFDSQLAKTDSDLRDRLPDLVVQLAHKVLPPRTPDSEAAEQGDDLPGMPQSPTAPPTPLPPLPS